LAKTKQVPADPLLAAFCQSVQERREDLGLSQEELASRAGLHRTYISDIERGSRNLSLKSLNRLAAALEISVSTLIRSAEQKVTTGDYLHTKRAYVREGSGKLQSKQVFTDVRHFLHKTKGSSEVGSGEPTPGCVLCEHHADFVETLAHDMKAPIINTDQALATLLAGNLGNLEPGQAKLLSMVKQRNDGLLELVHELLEINHYADPASLRFASVNMADTARSVVGAVAPIAETRNITVEHKVPNDLRSITGDRHALRRMLFALLEQSSRFAATSSTVSLVATNIPSAIQITITDSGEGIDPCDVPHIFEPSWQASPGNRRKAPTGLALYRVKAIVDAHKGNITCEKLSDGACVFKITLPA
jgi:transcriptional regulator with XRE-family HTH domain